MENHQAHHSEHQAHHSAHMVQHDGRKENHLKLAMSATLHCLIGCGLGEVAGMVIGTWLNWNNGSTMLLAIILGAIFGLLFGLIPLMRAGFPFNRAFRQVIIAEGLSIAVMETVEVLVQVYTPGVMDAHLTDAIFWLGMFLGLVAGFIAAFPVNFYLIKRGIHHKH
jgi:hypothetical protein